MEKLYTVVQMDFAAFDKKLQKVIRLRDELSQAIGELNGTDTEPFLVLKEESPAQNK